ncbi:hypothetical protein M8C21_005923 [Ambrosia artemisiifolia]|uniref:Uncharacterized protein n=1 Tax=Ambrosia artemisiifolia TaxID=4212 RepID=A0AAD5GL40_AMBAR|nr:hypothetical protein M8C21_005923 [Ambrosia artemisiifolia]
MDKGFYQQGVLFQSCTKDDESEMGMIGGMQKMNRTSSLSFSGSSGSSSNVVESIPIPIPESKHRAGLDGEWTVEEQYKLEQALVKYADESGMIKYVKIASTLRNKTVRDVAIRCRWMATKRRKHEERSLWKRSKDKKDKWVESSSKPNVSSVSTVNVGPLSVSMDHRVRGHSVHLEALQGSIRHLLEQNSRVLGQISINMDSLRDNVELFRQMKNNITAILNDMRCMPGPPLPVSLDEDLANTILSIRTQATFFSSGGMYMKQEPGFW